jgi:hypothetical protein
MLSAGLYAAGQLAWLAHLQMWLLLLLPWLLLAQQQLAEVAPPGQCL